MTMLASLFVGLLFGLGLIISGMSDPAKVLGFLDVAGNWNPSLALVMAGAIFIGVFTFRFAGRRKTSLLGLPMQAPSAKQIDRPLVLGSALFGIGWGLAGICPAPALVLTVTNFSQGSAFLLAMLAGMGLFEWQQRYRRSYSFA